MGRLPLGIVTNCHTLVHVVRQLLEAVPGGLLGPAAGHVLRSGEVDAAELASMLDAQFKSGQLVLLWELLSHWKLVLLASGLLPTEMAARVAPIVQPSVRGQRINTS